MQETPSHTFPKHFDGKHFYNPGGQQARGFRDVLRWQMERHNEASPNFVADVEPSVPPARVEGDGLLTTVVNHSTVLLQQKDCTILTDPIWSERASPLSWIGPRRRRIPGVRKEDLPKIDIVLLSHNHYDHLDLPTLRWLAKRGGSVFVAPLGVAKLLGSENIGPVYELDWGDSRTVGAATIHSVPAFHFSARGLTDRNQTLWCGYMIEMPNRLIYFAGDTAFGEHYSWIRDQFKAPDLSLLPIGAYKPRWFMSAVHQDPEAALKAHQILGSRTSIAIHHGTFKLADEALDAPSQELVAAGKPDSFLILANGQSFKLA